MTVALAAAALGAPVSLAIPAGTWAEAAGQTAADPSRQIEAVRKAFDSGHATEGLHLANTFSVQHKDDAEFHTQLGVVLATNKQYKAAQLELEKANALKPDS